MPPLEAMACGTPVISSDAGSLKEVLGNGAVTFESQNIEQLKTRILEFENLSPYEREQISILGKERAGFFLWTNEANNLMSFLRNAH